MWFLCFMYVCMYVCMYVSPRMHYYPCARFPYARCFVCMCVVVYLCLCNCTCVCMYAYVCSPASNSAWIRRLPANLIVGMYVYTSARLGSCQFFSACVFLCMYVCMYVCVSIVFCMYMYVSGYRYVLKRRPLTLGAQHIFDTLTRTYASLAQRDQYDGHTCTFACAIAKTICRIYMVL